MREGRSAPTLLCRIAAYVRSRRPAAKHRSTRLGFAAAEEASASAPWVRFAAVCDESVGTEVPPTISVRGLPDASARTRLPLRRRLR
ncbi:DUF6053 domain-containing protein [Lysobacter enzymogenes]|uniref:DUF6053 domain-containing protein n=1 Tax=Lysobacter enzymogenes TaxID=69 RepID=UPI003D2F65B1